MIKTTLPKLDREIDDKTNTIVRHESEIEVWIDTSIAVEEAWEKNFPEQAKRETLFAYIERIRDANEAGRKADLISELKAIYCCMVSDELPDFLTFARMFDGTDEEYVNKLSNKLQSVFKLVLGNSVVSEKN